MFTAASLTAYLMGAVAYLAIAIGVNGLAQTTEDKWLRRRRWPVLLAGCLGALGQSFLAIDPASPMGPSIQAACLLALPASLWPVFVRLRQGRVRIVNRRLTSLVTRAQGEARAAQAWLALAEQCGHVGHWQLTGLGRRLTWSDEMYRIHGLWREHFAPTLDSALAAFHPLDAKRVGEILNDAMMTRAAFEVAARLRRPDGEIRHVILRGAAIMASGDVLEGVNGVMVDVTEPRRRELALAADGTGRESLFEDPVTELPNRAQFDLSLHAEFKRAMRAKQPLGLVLFEIDGFFSFVEQYGSLEADTCLRQIALALHALPRRAGDVVARYGAAQFAVLLPLADTNGALRVARSLAEAVRARGLLHGGASNKMITVSAGAACITVDDLYNPLELTRRAAEALDAARTAGGDSAQPHRLRRPDGYALHAV